MAKIKTTSREDLSDRTAKRYVRINVAIDADLLAEALACSGGKTRRDLIDEALRLYVRREAQQELRSLFGKLHWEGDLKAIREDRHWQSEMDTSDNAT